MSEQPKILSLKNKSRQLKSGKDRKKKTYKGKYRAKLGILGIFKIRKAKKLIKMRYVSKKVRKIVKINRISINV